jgi:ABC-type Mn2+/Zn2+ transport system ATPase subunit/histidinol phosphatase-like PHP family hydrolase
MKDSGEDATLRAIEDELLLWSQGAEFRRADLHIHSYGPDGSYDVRDPEMTPEKIVDTALAEGLEVISITDHNAIGNVARAIKHSENQGMLVVPGVELSTPQGHLLVYFETFRGLQSFFGMLSFSTDQKFCNHTIAQCLDLACEGNGIGIAAHIDLSSGFEQAMPKYDAFKEGVLKCKNLLALEITDATNEAWFTDRDDNPHRKTLHGTRRTHLGEEETYELPKVMSSDAHSLKALGRNAKGAKKLTRFKMESLSFDALRIALVDSSARTRIEDLVPAEVPHFVGLKIEGGLLNNQSIHFSKNLTCIIGGRGTGKSTMLESLRAASGNTASESLLDSEVWPNRISLVYQDETGRRQILSRTKMNDVLNLSDPENGPVQIPIESYGQGETAETIQHCDKDPTILLRFLDGFIDLAELNRRDAELCELLLKNQSEIERLQIDVNTIQDVERAMNNAEAQLQVLKEKEASKIVELEEKLAKGKTFRAQLIENLNSLIESMRQALSDTSVADLVLEADGSSLVVGSEEFEELKQTVEKYTGKIQAFAETIQDESDKFVATLKDQLHRWAKKETDAQQQVEDIRKELESRNVKLDIAYIRKVTKDASDYKTKLVALTQKKTRLTAAFEDRKKLLSDRRTLKAKVFSTRSSSAIMLNRNLKATVIDYAVTVKYHEGTLSSEFEELLKTAMGWRTSQVPRAKFIASSISPLALAASLVENKINILFSIKDADGQMLFRGDEAKQVFDTLKLKKNVFAFERCGFEDCPELKVTREFAGTDGRSKFVTRDFGKLSLGQQQSLLLSIMLFSKSNFPLVIDQPEDNLDSEFIYKTFVRTLRLVKERRQIIIVTHNANIAVLGDAELIIPLRSTNDVSVIRDRGSIDTEKTKRITCTILEGSDQAFKKRQQVYGY